MVNTRDAWLTRHSHIRTKTFCLMNPTENMSLSTIAAMSSYVCRIGLRQHRLVASLQAYSRAGRTLGSPASRKNSTPFDVTNCRKVSCAAIRTLCPDFCKLLASAMKGCTSPREPTVIMQKLSAGVCI